MIRPFLIMAPAVGVGAVTAMPSAARTSGGQTYDPRPFSCPVVRVHDGDTFICASGARIRPQAIDVPEIGACRGHGGRCVSGDGYASRDALRRLALGQTALCRASGRSYDRISVVFGRRRRPFLRAIAVGPGRRALWSSEVPLSGADRPSKFV